MIFNWYNLNLHYGDFGSIKEILSDGLADLLENGFEDLSTIDSGKALQGILQLAVKNLNDEELFLMHGFKSMFSFKLADLIRKWLEQKFIIFFQSDKIFSTSNIENAKRNTVYLEKFQAVAKAFGVTASV